MNLLLSRPKIDALAELLPATRRSDRQRQHVDTPHTWENRRNVPLPEP
jgi:hypothetical protein